MNANELTDLLRWGAVTDLFGVLVTISGVVIFVSGHDWDKWLLFNS